ncbi:DNZ54_00345 family protein [Pantoea vagans]|uniref:DNZ54_00345 family protein n=1 Tax=Pantoea vagans TaxID=470934 RepID=UPI0023AFB481|nr:DNZ54_00345 family protein [Pantoea vagans]MDE8557308.1 DNZ54_00345 family protein [Pantoea vagans]MDE8577722.1 DNZ54_00345 family protein [Pantoea vagans]
MQMIKKWWFTALLTVLLTLVSISHGSFAGYPLAALLWADFFAWAVIGFSGLYACTLTGSVRKQVFAGLLRFAQLADRVPLRWYHRVVIAVVMWTAGWQLTLLMNLNALFYRWMIRPELKQAAA